MSKKIFYAVALFACVQNLFAQTIPYRSAENVYYWKNRMPHKAYWQQDVEYKIKASLNDSTDILSGSVTLEYFNNSPDTLRQVFFHLYQNAFQPESYLDKLKKNIKQKPHYGIYEQQKLGTQIISVQYMSGGAQGQRMFKPAYNIDNTIMQVNLDEPMLPGGSLTFNINFATYYDITGDQRRMKIFRGSGGRKHYDGVHWYPRMCVYDAKFGWDVNQHMGHEFYGDFGSYQVELTLPNQYILDGTGVMLNESEVLPRALRAQLDIANFKNKPYGSSASEIVKPDGSTKTWKFAAINVHDFAFTADPNYRISETNYNGIRCIALAQEPVASRWQNASAYLAEIIRVHSQEFGNYIYPKIIAADARDGMEYPMLTLDGGSDPGYRGLLVHEVGHNWYFGQVGNNETYRPMLDEGFTQFLTGWGLLNIDGDTLKREKFKAYKEKFFVEQNPMFNRILQTYLREALKQEDGFINTHSDVFEGKNSPTGGYRQAYYKTATMLYNLQYVLGNDLFKAAMINYFDQWKVCHPYVDDFRQSIISYTHVDLNWFFDQWIETDKRIDYRVGKIRSTKNKDEYRITFHRKERMQMPVDFTVISKDNIKHDFYIPNTRFVKSTNATVLPKWEGWDNLNDSYTAIVSVPGGIKKIEIDPSHRLADINRLNNRKCLPIKLCFDSQIDNTPSWTHYQIFWRPDLWYNNVDGIKAGLHFNGNYMNNAHFTHLSAWYNTTIGQSEIYNAESKAGNYLPVSVVASYRTPFSNFIKNSEFSIEGRLLDGLLLTNTRFEIKSRNKKNIVGLSFKTMLRNNIADADYLLYKDEWKTGFRNNTARLSLEHNYNYIRGTGKINLMLMSTSLGSDYDFASITGQVMNNNNIGKLTINTRMYAAYGWGNRFASESMVYLAGANPEEMMESKYVRSGGIVPNDWVGDYGISTNHFQHRGGLNLRGYAGYRAVTLNDNNEIIDTYKGTSGASASVEILLDRLIKLRPKITRNWLHLTPYIFGDAGIINKNTVKEPLQFDKLRADAGVGMVMTIKKFGPLEKASPLSLFFDVPLFLNTPPSAEPDYLKFRWIAGVRTNF